MAISGKFRIMSVMIMAAAIMAVEGSPELHKVGYRGWIPNYNYSTWSSQEIVYVGDWLLFNFDKHLYNVLEVNKTSYDNCNDKDFIKNITRGGRDVVQLTKPRPYYFLSGGGYCWNGMKVAVFVHQLPPSPSPAPASANTSPPLPTASSVFSFALALLVFAGFYS